MNEKIEEYFKLLYPNYEELEGEEKRKADSDKEFLSENIERIAEDYDHMHGPDTGAQLSGKSDAEIIKIALNQNIADMLFRIACPNWRELPREEQMEAFRMQDFLYEHPEEVKKEFESIMYDRDEYQLDEKTVVLRAIDSVKKKLARSEDFER